MPSYSFLTEHPSGRSVLFDLGVLKYWENLAPSITKRIKDDGLEVTVQKGVRELEENMVSTKRIKAIIWSHWHWDHTGDPSTFDESTALVVGPVFKKAFTPGYPSNQSPLSSKAIMPVANSVRYLSTQASKLEVSTLSIISEMVHYIYWIARVML